MSVATFKASLAAANKAIAALHETDKQLRAAHAEATRERKHLISAIEPTERVVANMVGLVDQIAEKHRRDIAIAHVACMSGALRVSTSGSVSIKRPELRSVFDALTLKDLCSLAPSLVKENLEEIIRSQPEGDGLPVEERQAALAVIDSRLTELESQHSELVEAAEASGVQIALLSAVAERRRMEARQEARVPAAGPLSLN